MRLLEDKDFKTELVAFPLGAETSEIKTEHRDDLIPIILRILYGRLRAAKRGKKDGGKGAVAARRNLILHHLLDLSEEHVKNFLDLAFEELYTGSDLKGNDSVYEYILAGGRAPSKSVKELQAHVEMVNAVLTKLGQLMVQNLEYIMRTIVWIGFIVDELNKSSGKVVGFKALRNAVYAKLGVFYAKFTGFVYSPEAEKTIFKVFIEYSAIEHLIFINFLPMHDTRFIYFLFSYFTQISKLCRCSCGDPSLTFPLTISTARAACCSWSSAGLESQVTGVYCR